MVSKGSSIIIHDAMRAPPRRRTRPVELPAGRHVEDGSLDREKNTSARRLAIEGLELARRVVPQEEGLLSLERDPGVAVGMRSWHWVRRREGGGDGGPEEGVKEVERAEGEHGGNKDV